MHRIIFREVIKDSISIFLLLVFSIAILILCLYLFTEYTTEQLYKEYGVEVISQSQNSLTNRITSLSLRC